MPTEKSRSSFVESAVASLHEEVPPMMEEPEDSEMLAARGRIPQHVVYREFVNETVVLNLQTGTYHGLNPTAGKMLTAVDGAETLRDAAALLVDEFGWDLPTVEADLVGLCRTLAEDGLLEVSDNSSK